MQPSYGTHTTTHYTPELLASSDCRVACVWDEVKECGEAWAKEISVPYVADLNEILGNKEIDGVVITAPTTMHKEIIIAAANAGKHVFVEKSLALSYQDALEIQEAIERNHVIFSIAYIRCTSLLHSTACLNGRQKFMANRWHPSPLF